MFVSVHTYTYIHVYVYVYRFLSVCVCVCVCIVFCSQEDSDDVSADDVETALLQLNVAGKY